MPDTSSDKLGDCYKAALENAEELALIKSTVEGGAPDALEVAATYERLGLASQVEIVHGTVLIPEGPHAGRTTGHAWIEVGSNAFETSNDQLDAYPISHYYEHFSIVVEVRYSPDRARQLVNATGHYGPWHR
jgi:hypothetical protein